MSPSFSARNVTCDGCGRTGLDVAKDGWYLFLLGSPEFPLDTEQNPEFGRFINTSMRLVARDYKQKWEKALEERDNRNYRELCESWGLNFEAGVKHHYLHDQKYTTDSGHERTDFEYRDNDGNGIDMPDKYAFNKAVADMWTATDRGRRPSIVRAPDPVQVPEGLTVYVSHPEGLSEPFTGPLGGDLPEDPLRTNWLSYWTEVWDLVRASTGIAIEPVEAPNQYHNDINKSEPWWTFEVNGTSFTVGPRKRVINITARNDEGIVYAPLQALGSEDRVTFTHKTMWEDKLQRATESLREKHPEPNEWIPKLREAELRLRDEDTTPHLAKQMTMHAWTKDKAVEYLTLFIKTVL